MKFVTLAAIAILETQAIQNKAALDLLSEAFENAEEGSEQYAQLSAIMGSLSDSEQTDADILTAHSQFVQVPIDEKRALAFKVSPTYT